MIREELQMPATKTPRPRITLVMSQAKPVYTGKRHGLIIINDGANKASGCHASIINTCEVFFRGVSIAIVNIKIKQSQNFIQ